MRQVTAAALFGLLAIAPVSGQDAPTESVLDRVVARQPSGGPFVFAPPIKDWSDQAVIGVGSAADIVVGFEAAPDVERLLVPMTDARRAQLDSRRRVSLAGKTVREALDTIVAIDPRYRWIDVDGVPVVRPWGSWMDPKHLLNQVVGGVDWPETNLGKALFDVQTLMTGTSPSPPLTASHPPFFRVQTGPIAIMALLNAVAVAHGHAAWQVRHRCSPNDPRALELQMLSYLREEVPGALAGCRNLAREQQAELADLKVRTTVAVAVAPPP
jgi:hypothetical protein